MVLYLVLNIKKLWEIPPLQTFIKLTDRTALPGKKKQKNHMLMLHYLYTQAGFKYAVCTVFDRQQLFKCNIFVF